MGRRKKKQPAVSVSSDQGVGSPKTTAPRYIVDEFGYIGTTESLEWQPGERQPEQPRAQHTIDAGSGMKSENLTNIPESKPAGFLDLSKLPVPTGPFAAVSQKEQSSKRPRHNRKIQKQTQSDPMVKCPHCSAKVRQSQLEAHQNKAHAAAKAASSQAKQNTRATLLTEVARAWGIPSKSIQSISVIDGTNGEISTILTTGKTTGGILVACPLCNAAVKPTRLDRHFRKVHQQYITPSPSSHTTDKASDSGLILCPVCKMALDPSRLAQHVLEVHRQQIQPKPSSIKNKPGGQSTGQRRPLSQPASNDSQEQDTFDQSFHEARFGDKYVGLSRREGSGRFGSLPLYDDYGDEADAD